MQIKFCFWKITSLPEPFYRRSNPITMGKLAYMTAFFDDSSLDLRHGVHRGNEPLGDSDGQHRQVVQMVAGGQNSRRIEPQFLSQAGQRRAFGIGRMTHPAINVVAHERQVGNGLASLVQRRLNLIAFPV